jgi:hypothetical protein
MLNSLGHLLIQYPALPQWKYMSFSSFFYSGRFYWFSSKILREFCGLPEILLWIYRLLLVDAITDCLKGVKLLDILFFSLLKCDSLWLLKSLGGAVILDFLFFESIFFRRVAIEIRYFRLQIDSVICIFNVFCISVRNLIRKY